MRPFPLTSLARLEWINNISFSPNTVGVLPGNQLPADRFMWGLHLILEGRATMPASGGPSALSADGIVALIDRIRVSGYHRGRRQPETIIELRGPDVYELGNMYSGATQLNLPSSWSFSANATNDFRVGMVVPFVPPRVSPYEQARYLLDNPNYDALKLEVKFGDGASCFGSYTNAPSLSAYGSTTGSPRVIVAGYFALAGPGKFLGTVPGRTTWSFQEVTGSLLATTATRQRLVDIPTGGFVRAITIKTGVKSTTVSSGNDAYASLSDSILSEIKVHRGINNPVRYAPLYHLLKEEYRTLTGRSPATGYARIDFAGRGALGEAFDARALSAGPSGRVDFYLEADVSGASGQAALFIFEQIIALPS